MNSGFEDDEAYNVYSEAWRKGSNIGSNIYRPTKNADKDMYGGEDLDELRKTNRFQRLGGPFVIDVRKLLGCFGSPFPLVTVTFTRPISYIVCFWGTPLPHPQPESYMNGPLGGKLEFYDRPLSPSLAGSSRTRSSAGRSAAVRRERLRRRGRGRCSSRRRRTRSAWTSSWTRPRGRAARGAKTKTSAGRTARRGETTDSIRFRVFFTPAFLTKSYAVWATWSRITSCFHMVWLQRFARIIGWKFFLYKLNRTFLPNCIREKSLHERQTREETDQMVQPVLVYTAFL